MVRKICSKKCEKRKQDLELSSSQASTSKKEGYNLTMMMKKTWVRTMKMRMKETALSKMMMMVEIKVTMIFDAVCFNNYVSQKSV